MTCFTLTVLRNPIPADADGPQGAYVWSIDRWDPEPECVAEGRSHNEKVAYIDGFAMARALGMKMIGGDHRSGYELTKPNRVLA